MRWGRSKGAPQSDIGGGGTFGGESGAMEGALARRSRHFLLRTHGGCRNWPGGGLEVAAELGPRIMILIKRKCKPSYYDFNF